VFKQEYRYVKNANHVMNALLMYVTIMHTKDI